MTVQLRVGRSAAHVDSPSPPGSAVPLGTYVGVSTPSPQARPGNRNAHRASPSMIHAGRRSASGPSPCRTQLRARPYLGFYSSRRLDEKALRLDQGPHSRECRSTADGPMSQPIAMTEGTIALARLIPVSSAANATQSRVPGATTGGLTGISGHTERVRTARSLLPRPEVPPRLPSTASPVPGGPSSSTVPPQTLSPLPQPQAQIHYGPQFLQGGRNESERLDGMSESVDDIIGIRKYGIRFCQSLHLYTTPHE